MQWILSNTSILWAAAGLLLLIGEMVAPGLYFLWIGLAALELALIVWVVPDLSLTFQGVLFALSVGVWIGFSVLFGYGKAPASKQVNRRGRRLVGQVFEVSEAIHNGRGRIQVADGSWIAVGPDTAAGEPVRVVQIDGNVAHVEAVTPVG